MPGNVLVVFEVEQHPDIIALVKSGFQLVERLDIGLGQYDACGYR